MRRWLECLGVLFIAFAVSPQYNGWAGDIMMILGAVLYFATDPERKKS